jgi:Trk K+ transport system NAD-binding subunit
VTEAGQPRRAARSVPTASLRGHIVLCGLESLGVRTLEELIRLGERVVVVIPTQGAATRHRELAERLAVGVVTGDPTETRTLREAGVPGAKAVIFSSEGDVANIHAALAATALAPQVRVVLRIFDEEFARRVETTIPNCNALSASALAAPGFVSALDEADEGRSIDVLGRRLVVRHAAPSDPGVICVLADDRQAPVSLFPDGSAAVTGEETEFLSLIDPSAIEPGSAPKRRRRIVRPPTPRVAWFRRVDRRFWMLALVIAVLVATTALVFKLVTGAEPTRVVYQAIRGVFGGISDDFLTTDELRFFALALTILGAGLLAAFYGLIADVILTTRLSNLLGPHVADVRDHVVVVGLGTIGYRVAVAFRDKGFKVVAADTAHGRFTEAARARGIAVVVSDGASPETLKQLRVDQARALVAATDDDAANLSSALHARGLRPDMPIVVRLFDPDLAVRLERALGGYESRSVSALAGPAFAAAAIGREVLATIPVGLQRVLIIARVPVAPGSRADGSTVAAEEGTASSIELGGCRVIAIAEGDGVRWKPSPDDAIAAGQELVIVATRRGMAMVVQRGAGAGEHADDADEEAAEGFSLPLIGEISVDRLRDTATRVLRPFRR